VNFKSKVEATYQVVVADFKTVALKFANQGIKQDIIDSYMEKYKALKPKMKKGAERDIDFWGKKPFTEFQAFVDQVEEQKSSTQERKEQRRQGMEGAELLAENDKWEVYFIKNQQACVHYGLDTQWCLTDSRIGPAKWNEYTAYGHFYFFISKTHPRRHPLSKIAYFDAPGGYQEVTDAVNDVIIINGVSEQAMLDAIAQGNRKRSQYHKVPNDIPPFPRKPFSATQEASMRLLLGH
jgi:hypothetical protein